MTAMEYPEALDEIVEAALLAAGEPLDLDRLETLFDDHERPPRSALRETLSRLATRHQRGAMELLETASGYQLRIRPRLSAWVSRLWEERPQRYSRALLETLALIAYRQPVTRADIEDVRGVSVSSSIMRTLAERGWIRVVGHRDVPGRPAVYATTRAFLDDFGLKTLDELPPMHELKGLDDSDYEREEAPPPPQSELLAQADESPEEAAETEAAGVAPQHDETPEAAVDADAPTAAADTADAEHAETASERPTLSFADLEARLAERARSSVDEDGGAGAESTPDETPDDS
ncbi:SMC-Scp complex subunit ScpB [Billgrantia gudaonensis]|uniref:Segregation and condensation protein B n=1 Tax=Billgrantia gudaonensis TaxID=376427 RepID=A0A1G8R241_9GAMM|nr:SMC-Scp complex subunit ScpB [Halomonas gudaonensis]SDJ11054.1 segregation and condensation protein B [Halomonas gudaonensis]